MRVMGYITERKAKGKDEWVEGNGVSPDEGQGVQAKTGSIGFLQKNEWVQG